jgi:hypothetical protein
MWNNNFGAEWSLGGGNSNWSCKLQYGKSSDFVQTEIQFEGGRVTSHKTDNLFLIYGLWFRASSNFQIK